MLDAAAKRCTYTVCDILIGKVPDPKSQVGQVSGTLIYKFMDDIDAEGEVEQSLVAANCTSYNKEGK